jgi:6-pyruvoyltetrahydropterin/6-carboxytetrahydropterin synthase
VEIYRTFTIDSAHRLPKVPLGHKCGQIHGHTFIIDVFVSGEVPDETGWVVDFADIKKAFLPIHDQLDHCYLNDITGLENPTSENIARWIWQKLSPHLSGLSKIRVKETPQSGCTYSGE